jgi:hypothetical protein
MLEVGVPSASVLYSETIDDERVLTIISLRGQRMKVPLASTGFSIPSSPSLIVVTLTTAYSAGMGRL